MLGLLAVFGMGCYMIGVISIFLIALHDTKPKEPPTKEEWKEWF